MKLTSNSAIKLIGCAAIAFGLAQWSACIGRRVWSPEVFAWRNPFKIKPNIERQTDCPVYIVSPRFYSFMSLGSAIGSVLKFEVKNVSKKTIHSFGISFLSSDPLDTGKIGVQPETALQPGNTLMVGDSSRGNDRVSIRVDYIQFTDGDVWYPESLLLN